MHVDSEIQYAGLVTRSGEGPEFATVLRVACCCRSRAPQFVQSQLRKSRRGCGLPLLENSFANADAYSAVTVQFATHADAHQHGTQ